MTATPALTHGITVTPVPTGDEPHVGFNTRASCLCGWQSHVMPRGDVVQAGRHHVLDSPTPAAGPVPCEPWCAYSDGHRNEPFLEDQNCFGPMVRVELALHDEQQEDRYDEGQQSWVAGPDHLDVYAAKNTAGPVHIEVLHEPEDRPCTVLKLTLDEAGDLVEAVQLVLGQVQG